MLCGFEVGPAIFVGHRSQNFCNELLSILAIGHDHDARASVTVGLQYGDETSIHTKVVKTWRHPGPADLKSESPIVLLPSQHLTRHGRRKDFVGFARILILEL